MTVAVYYDTINIGQEIRYSHERGDFLSIELTVRQYLIEHGIKQSFVAEKCGWTKQKTNAIVTGKKKITAEEYGSLCDAIGVSYDYFYNAAQDSVLEGVMIHGKRKKSYL